MSIAVGIGEEGREGESVIGLTRAVVVDAIADFGGIGVDGGFAVVAIGAVERVPVGKHAIFNAQIGVTKAVGVRVGVIHLEAQAIVGHAGAIVVDAVAHFRIAWADVGVAVVAVGPVQDVALERVAGRDGGGGVFAHFDGFFDAVFSIDARFGADDFVGADRHHTIKTVAVFIGVGVPHERIGGPIVDLTRAVDVDAVADFFSPRVDVDRPIDQGSLPR